MSEMDAREVMDKQISEREFQAQVVEYARLHGWMVYGVIDRKDYALRYDKGYPDLTMVHGERRVLIFAELKREGAKVAEAQDRWLRALQAVADQAIALVPNIRFAIKVCTWRPSDWDAIEKVLGHDQT